MPERNPKQEIRRIRNLLLKMAETSEKSELTGSFEGGIRNYVKRYNAIVEHLEEEDIVPEDLFSELDEDETNFGQLGAEATLLADYISEDAEESPKENAKREQKEGLGPLVALAPFLGSSELSKLVRERLGVTVTVSSDQPTPPKPPVPPVPPVPPHGTTPPAPSQGPDLSTIVVLAPFLDAEAVSQMVFAAVSQRKVSDPNALVALAPFMDKADFSRLVREQLPGWFGAQPNAPNAENTPEPQPPTSGGSSSSWSTLPDSNADKWPTPPTPPTPPNELR